MLGEGEKSSKLAPSFEVGYDGDGGGSEGDGDGLRSLVSGATVQVYGTFKLNVHFNLKMEWNFNLTFNLTSILI